MSAREARPRPAERDGTNRPRRRPYLLEARITWSGMTANHSQTIAPAPAVRRPLPSGTVAFVFTDIEGSTRLLERVGEAYAHVLDVHRAILAATLGRRGGTVVDAQGDETFVVFERPSDAIAAAIDSQRSLAAHDWPSGARMRVRMGIHAGEALSTETGYVGIEVHRAARVMAAGHGGQVLLSSAAAAVAGDELPSGAAIVDLGEHQLKDLGRPERLFQLVHPDLERDFPPLRTPAVRPHYLPTLVSSFVGRDRELDVLRSHLEDPSIRLLTLTGPGGTGKTRLAVHVAAEQANRFDHGVFFVDLAQAADTDSVLAQIARALGVGLSKGQSALGELKRFLSDRDVMLVLDNFEQVTVAAPTLAELLEACPRLRVLVTSREALFVRGEQRFAVPPMSLPDDPRHDGHATEINQFEAIQLFVDRARTVQPEFRLTDDNAAAVAAICRRLDGLPLAIELATARIGLFPPHVLGERLTGSLGLLRGGARDLPARQQTLRDTIDWSYDLLDAPEQRLFELLSVFSGASIDAVERVAQATDALLGPDLDVIDGLSSLLAKSLLVQVEAPGGAPRFRMLETIHHYARERLDDRQEFAIGVRRAHAVHFADVARSDSDTGDQRQARIDADIENVRSAWRYWVHQGDLDRLNGMVDGLWSHFDEHAQYRPTIELATDLLELLKAAPPSRERLLQEITLRTSRARTLTWLEGYTAQAVGEFADAVTLLERHGEPGQLLPALRTLAIFYEFQGDFAKATELAARAVHLADEQPDVEARIDAHLVYGSALSLGGDLRGSLEQCERGIAAAAGSASGRRRYRLGQVPAVGCFTTSAFVLWMLGRPDTASERAARGIALAEELDHAFSIAYANFHAALLSLWRSEPHVTRQRAARVLEVADANDLPVWRALGTFMHGAAVSILGDPGSGLAQVDDGLGQYDGLRTPPIFGPFVRLVHAGALAAAGRFADAEQLVDEALAIVGAQSGRPAQAPILLLKGDLVLASGGSTEGSAESWYRSALETAAASGATMIQLQAAVRLARLVGPRQAEDLALVRNLYGSFEEGFETLDLVAARKLIGPAAALTHLIALACYMGRAGAGDQILPSRSAAACSVSSFFGKANRIFVRPSSGRE
jgi:predicted ATPase/class 3 adenylate cyclase